MKLEKRIIDLSGNKITILNPVALLLSEEQQLQFSETNNEFGWNVSKAELVIDKSRQELIEFKLLSSRNKILGHAKLIETRELVYWRFEYLSRELNHSPDMFDPNLENFLNYYYQDINNDHELLLKALSFPAVLYNLTLNRKLKSIRYALSVNKTFTKPLFYFSFDNGFLQSVTDWQGIEMKNIVYPSNDYPDYLLQKFSKKPEKNFHHKENALSAKTENITFSGFKEYKIKYLTDSCLEQGFIKYCFFADDLRKIIKEELLLKYIPTVNYHLIKPCNMRCNHCFSDFSELKKGQLSLEEAKKIIEEIAKIKSIRKLNFSGGEPTMFKGIDILIQLSKEKGFETSMITNGFILIENERLFDSLIPFLDILGLSIDSFNSESNLIIGRHVRKKTLSIDKFISLAEKCHKNKTGLKINTVVTKLNFNQNLANDLIKLKPKRWKILRMLPISSQNEKANDIIPSDEEFNAFIDINRDIAERNGIKVVSEENFEMTGSYIMISPDGKFFNNIDGEHKYSEDYILDVGIEEALSQTPLLREVFYKREGDYSCN